MSTIRDGSMGFNLTLTNNEYLRGLRESMNGTRSFSDQVQRETQSIQSSFNQLGPVIAGAFSVAAAVGFTKQLINVRGEFQQLEIAFTTMLGSQEKSNILMADMIDLAAKTPFGMKEVSEGAKRLLAFQVPAEQIIDTLTRIGNVSAGLGVPMGQLIHVYGQVKAQGKLMTNDLYQFMNAGIPIISELGKVLGRTDSEIKQLVSDGKVGFNEIQQVIANMTNEGGLFFNLMEKQSESLTGQIANLQDAFESMLNEIGKDTEGYLSKGIEGVTLLVENYEDVLRVLGVLIATYGAYRAAIIATAVAQKASIVAGNIQSLVQLASSVRSARDAQLFFNMAVRANPYVIAATALAGLIAGIYAFRKETSLAIDIQENLTNANIEAEKSIIKEKAQLQQLINVAKDEKRSKENRISAIKKLNEISPQYLGNLNLENINTQEATKAVENYSKALFENAKAKAMQLKYEKLVSDRLEIENKTSNDYKDNTSKAFDFVFGETKALKSKADVIKEVTEANKGAKLSQKQLNEEIEKAYKRTGLEKKHVELAKVDAQLMDMEKNILSTQAGIDNILNSKAEIIAPTEEKKKKTKKAKTTKSDDPLEIFKKQLSDTEKEYNRFFLWMDSQDEQMMAGAQKLFDQTLGNKGKSYMEYLRKLQAELSLVADKSSFNQQRLWEVNDQIQNLINTSEVDLFKKGIDKEIENANSLLDVIKLIQEETEKLDGKGDQISLNKKDYLEESLKKNQENIEQRTKQILESNRNSYSELLEAHRIYTNDLKLLDEELTAAYKSGDEKRINNAKEAIEVLTENFSNATKGKTGDADYDAYLESYKSFKQKIEQLENDYDKKISTARKHNDGVLENELLKSKKEALSNLAVEELKASQLWTKMFLESTNMNAKQLRELIAEFDKKIIEIGPTLNPADLKAITDQVESLKDKLIKIDPFEGITSFFKKIKSGEFTIDGLEKDFQALQASVDLFKEAMSGVFDIADTLGIQISDSSKEVLELSVQLFESGSQLAKGIASGNPVDIVKGSIGVLTNGFKLIFGGKDRRREKEIKRYQQAVNELTKAFQDLEYATSKALGGDSYKHQKGMMENLIKQQVEYQKMIDAEKRKKKSDKGKIADWEQAMKDSAQRIKEIMDDLVQDVLQTNAKDLANELGNALAEAFGKGEDAAKSFEQVANNVLKNAVLNQLKKQFLEKQLQGALDKLYADMGGDKDGNFNWNGLSPEEMQAFRDKIKEISGNFNAMLGEYSDLFGDLGPDPNQDALQGAIKGVSEDTAALIAGQMNAIRILQVEANELWKTIHTSFQISSSKNDLMIADSNNILRNSLIHLANIELNTRYNKFIEDIYKHLITNKDTARAHGF